MPSRIYPSDPNQNPNDWCLEGELTDEELAEFAKNRKMRSVTFFSNPRMPHRPFRHLAGLQYLKFVLLKQCELAPEDLGDLAAIPKLEHLYVTNCPVIDSDLEPFRGHPRLLRVWLNGTKVTDAALQHVAAIPALQALDLDNTAITDQGFAYLQSAAHLNTLHLRNTAITNAGILQLAVLPKLRLTKHFVTGTTVTEAGLDALFSERKRLKSAAKRGTSSTSKKGGHVKAPPKLDESEIEAAKSVLYGYFKAMNEMEVDYCNRMKAVDQIAENDQRVKTMMGLFNSCRNDCRQIFDKFCTAKKRAYGRPDNVSIGTPDYDADPAKEPITSIEVQTRNRIVIETKRDEPFMQDRYQYVLLRKGDRWLIDSKKIWGSGWEWTIL